MKCGWVVRVCVCASACAREFEGRAGGAHRGVALCGGDEQRRAAIGWCIDRRVCVEQPCSAVRVPERSGPEQGRTAIGKAAIHIHVGVGREQRDHLCMATLHCGKEGGRHHRRRLVEELAHRGRVAQDARAQHLGGEPLVVQLARWRRRQRGPFMQHRNPMDASARSVPSE